MESITVCQSRAESKESAKVESIDRVGQKLPRIDCLARLDLFWGLIPGGLEPHVITAYFGTIAFLLG